MTGIVLAGGNNTRINCTKGLLRLGGNTIIEHVISAVSQFCSELLLVTNTPELYSWLKIRTVKDKIPGLGPLGGIEAGLSNSSSLYNLVVPCDLPFISTGLLSYMNAICADYDAVIPRLDGYPEPLCAIYSRSCLPFIRKKLEEKAYKIQGVFSLLNIYWIEQDKLSSLQVTKNNFHNVNTREDFLKAISIYDIKS